MPPCVVPLTTGPSELRRKITSFPFVEYFSQIDETSDSERFVYVLVKQTERAILTCPTYVRTRKSISALQPHFGLMQCGLVITIASR